MIEKRKLRFWCDACMVGWGGAIGYRCWFCGGPGRDVPSLESVVGTEARRATPVLVPRMWITDLGAV